MKLYHFKIIITILGFTLVSSTAVAQFNPRTQTSTSEAKIDTLKINTNQTSEMLDFQIYNQAYDKYLRELQKKHRNFLKVKTGLSATQTSYSNWAAGGNNSFSGRTFLNVEHKYTSPVFNIKTTFDAAYGMLSADEKVRKSEDFFNLTSSPSWRLSPRWEFTGSLIFRSQFTDSYKTVKVSGVEVDQFASTFFAPAYLTLAAGFTYTNQPKTVEAYFAPISGDLRMILNQDVADKGTFGDQGRKFIPKFVNYFRFKYEEKLYAEKLSVKFKLENFWGYEKMSRIITESTIEYKLTKLLNTSFYLRTIYDEDVKTPEMDNHFQFTETIGFGISYEIGGRKHPAPPQTPRKRNRR